MLVVPINMWLFNGVFFFNCEIVKTNEGTYLTSIDVSATLCPRSHIPMYWDLAVLLYVSSDSRPMQIFPHISHCMAFNPYEIQWGTSESFKPSMCKFLPTCATSMRFFSVCWHVNFDTTRFKKLFFIDITIILHIIVVYQHVVLAMIWPSITVFDTYHICVAFHL